MVSERIEDAFGLNGKVAVITGASSGIGREAAIIFAEAGARVVLADIDKAGLEACAAEIGDSATMVPCDISERAAIDRLAECALTIADRIDVWANVAGIIKSFAMDEATEADLDRILSVNLKAAYWGCVAAGKAMRTRQGGSIINMSSGGGDSAAPGLSAYSIAKAGMNALTRSVAREFGPHGVRANSIAPGFIQTPMVAYRYRKADGSIDAALRDETLRQRRAISPLGMTGHPSDVAYMMLYLASDAGRFVTGQILRPNGGVTML